MVKLSGGEAMVQSLVREGVEVVFGIQAAAHMADSYARASGKPGVALVVPGTGVYGWNCHAPR